MDDAALSLWLRLREQRDWKARSVDLTNAIVATLPDDRPVGVLDLATGAGSNLRYLVERLPPRQRWLLIDRSAALLSEAGTRTRAWAAERGYDVQLRADESVRLSIAGPQLDCEVEAQVQDLAALGDPSIFAGRHLVTASALLDLVSEAWLRALASRCRAAGAAALLTISYDGRSSCAPVEPEDEFVRELMNAHQLRDKGLGGPAEGPNAASCAARCFADEGFEVKIAASDWRLDPSDAAMQRTLIDGWARAASEQAPDAAETIASWRTRRLAHVDAGVSHVVVGHQDVAAWRE
jgi:hypothetical protein